MNAKGMISAHPDVKGNISEALVRCIDECADACLAQEMVQQLKQYIRLNLDCANVCVATGALASRRTGSNEQTLRQMLQGLRSCLPRVWRGVRAPRW